MKHEIQIGGAWDGGALRGDERPVRLSWTLGDHVLDVAIDAPLYDDPAPQSAPGPTSGLWEFEVVELFLVGPGSRYLELEFGPRGHYLALSLEGVRQVAGEHRIDYRATRTPDRWHGLARVPRAQLSEPLVSWNAFAIHGVGAGRRYLAAQAVPGPQPDFHRLEEFIRL